jgi:quinoprotein glucose dehydrogenase
MYRLGARSTRGGIVRRLPPLKASVCLGLAVATASAIRAQERGPANEWRYFGGNKAFTRYSSLAQINRANVKDLRIAWRRPAVSDQLAQAFPELRPNNYLRSTPIVIGGVLYAQNVHGLVVAFDGETGKTVWEQELFARTREEAAGSSTRGVDYWQGGSGNADRRIFAIRGEYLYALNAQTGKPIPGFGDEGRASLHFQENQPLAARFNDSTGPLVVGNVVIVTGNTAGAGDTGTFKKEAAPEDVRGFDARNGKLLWTFHVVPRPGEYGIETWGNESWKIAGDLGAWNPMTADEDLGYVYIPLTAPTASAWGVWRPGDNLFADSLVALDARTGKRVWHFQTVHHNLWEWENVGPAMLGDITVDGRRIKAVMQPNKNGFLFVLDRTNGKPVWPIEERPVPQSNVPGERTSPTQPFPTKPPAFDRQGVADTDLIDYTPELKARAREIAKEFVTGPLFTPPSITTDEPGTKRGTLMLPGSWGAANWNTGAFDPETGLLLRGLRIASGAVESRHQEDDESGSDDGVRERGDGP